MDIGRSAVNAQREALNVTGQTLQISGQKDIDGEKLI
jgi:hypothetical protein